MFGQYFFNGLVTIGLVGLGALAAVLVASWPLHAAGLYQPQETEIVRYANGGTYERDTLRFVAVKVSFAIYALAAVIGAVIALGYVVSHL